VHLAENPMTAVAMGTGKILSELHYLRRVTVTANRTIGELKY